MNNEELKRTLQSPAKMVVLSTAITLLSTVAVKLVELGISPRSISFLTTSLDVMAQEVEEAGKSIQVDKDKVEFNNIVKNLKNFWPKPDKDKDEG